MDLKQMLDTDRIENSISKLGGGIFKTRLQDPIISTYLGSFLICNWKIFFYLFSSKAVEEKVLTINTLLHGDNTYTFSFLNINSWENFVSNTLPHFMITYVIPGILTYIVLFLMPRLLKTRYEEIQDNKVTKINQEYTAQLKLEPVAKQINNLNNHISDLIKIKTELEIQKQTDRNTIERFEKNLTEKDNLIKETERDYLQSDALAKQFATENSLLKQSLTDIKLECARLDSLLMVQQKKHITQHEKRMEIVLEKLEDTKNIESFKNIAKILYIRDTPQSELYDFPLEDLISLDLIEALGYTYGLTSFGKDIFHHLNGEKIS